MSAVSKPRLLTAAEYLAIEKSAPHKSEFYHGEMFAMAGAARFHNRVKENLIRYVGNQLDTGPCETYSSDQRVQVDRTGLYTYPDLMIVCGEPETDPLDADAFRNPVVIFEVLSPSTERYDRGLKFLNYRQLDSLREYVLVSPDEPVIERFTRQPDGTWTPTRFEGLTAEFVLESVPVRLPMTHVYRRVRFPTPPPDPAPPADRRPGDP